MNEMQLTSLMRASAELVSHLNEQEVIQKVILEAARVLNAEACSVILLDDQSEDCFFYGSSDSSDELKKVRFNRELGIVGRILSGGKPVTVNNAACEPGHYQGVDQCVDSKTKSLIGVPLKSGDVTFGVVEAINKKNCKGFTSEDTQLLSIFANFAAVALNNARVFTRCRTATEAFRQVAHREDYIMGSSDAMRRVWQVVDKVSQSNATVLIHGESGCGKEVVANAVHRLSNRAEQPCICVNCAALEANLLASELFGHEKGAFTGAQARRIGRFELAGQGTLFLDEIGDADLTVQARLLRVLETRTFERLGNSQSIRTEARVIAATNVDLVDAVKAGTFREDLYHRLNVVAVCVPPLRERRSDISELLAFFSGRFAAEMKARRVHFTPGALTLLEAYDWPGNVRELKNLVERTTVLADSEEVDETELIQMFPSLCVEAGGEASPGSKNNSLWDQEKTAIEQALNRCHGNQSAAARKLGIERHHLRYRMKKFGISHPLTADDGVL